MAQVETYGSGAASGGTAPATSAVRVGDATTVLDDEQVT